MRILIFLADVALISLAVILIITGFIAGRKARMKLKKKAKKG